MNMNVVIAHGGNIGFPGGGTNRVLAFAGALADADYEVTLVVPKPVGEVPAAIQNRVEIYIVPVKPQRIWDQVVRAILVSLKAKKLAEKEKALLQLEHSTLGGIAASLGCSEYVLDVHDLEFDGSLYKSVPFGPRLIRHLERKAVSKASKIIAVSEPMKAFLMNEWHVPRDKIAVIPNGYFDEKLKKYASSEEKGLISFIGVLTHNVDYDKVIWLATSRSDAQIYLIGDGPMRPYLLKKLEEEGIKNVIVPGFLPDDEAYGIIARSQVCIFPLRNTVHTKVAMHMKALDYAALGKAIATDKDGTAGIFKEHNAALISDPDNPEEFVANVQRLLGDRDLRRKLGENAKKLVENFTWAKQGEKLVMVYAEI